MDFVLLVCTFWIHNLYTAVANLWRIVWSDQDGGDNRYEQRRRVRRVWGWGRLEAEGAWEHGGLQNGCWLISWSCKVFELIPKKVKCQTDLLALSCMPKLLPKSVVHKNWSLLIGLDRRKQKLTSSRRCCQLIPGLNCTCIQGKRKHEQQRNKTQRTSSHGGADKFRSANSGNQQ